MKRSYDKEMMDLPGNDAELLAEDLLNLRRLNRYLNGCRSVILGFKQALGGDKLKNFSALDIGTGSADIPAALHAWATAKGFATTIVGLEAEALTAGIATTRSKPFAGVKIVQGDGSAPPFSPKSFDFVVASQFLHHFSEEKMIELLKRWATLARKGIVISDLIRHPLAYHGIRLLTKLATRNVMTLTDAPLSVRRALTFKEWRELFLQAAVGPVEMFSVFPFRMAAAISLGSR